MNIDSLENRNEANKRPLSFYMSSTANKRNVGDDGKLKAIKTEKQTFIHDVDKPDMVDSRINISLNNKYLLAVERNRMRNIVVFRLRRGVIS